MTILFLHGWGADEHTFTPIRTFFGSNARCIFINFDCNPQHVYNLEDYTIHVEQALEREQITSCCIIAHSFGARVAVLLATRNPGMVEKMVLTGAAGIPPRPSLYKWLKIKWYKLTGLGRGSTDYRKLSAAGRHTFQNIIHRDLRPEIASLTVPALLVYGSRDKSTPLYMGKMWTKLQRNAMLKVYRHAGHFCFIDNPGAFIKDTWEFLLCSH